MIYLSEKQCIVGGLKEPLLNKFGYVRSNQSSDFYKTELMISTSNHIVSCGNTLVNEEETIM